MHQALYKINTAQSVKKFPESGLEVVYAHDFELYNKDFKPGEANSKMYIYVPIK